MERAGMDDNEQSIKMSEDIVRLRGLAIDFVTKNLFSLDSKRHILSSSDYGVSDRPLTPSNDVISEFAVDVFEDWLYWYNWFIQSIKNGNKFTGTNLTIVASKIMSSTNLKVYHSNKQPKGINYCDNINSVCSHFCLSAPHLTEESTKFTCFCPAGMVLGDDKKICVTGINYCDNINSVCSHFCLSAPHLTKESTKFSYFCPAGMVLGDDKKICVTDIHKCQSDEFPCAERECIRGTWWLNRRRYYRDGSDEEICVSGSLLFSNATNPLMSDLETHEKTIIASELNSIEAIDYGYARGVVLCSEGLNRRICRMILENGTSILNSPSRSNIDTVVKNEHIRPGGIAVDRIHGNVYWTDYGRKTISVDTLDGSVVRVLFHKNIIRPRAIVVNPLEGWFFWTDMGRHHKIERAGMDGSERSVIISPLVLLRRLAIDFVTKKLFSLDAGSHILSSSNYDGSERKLTPSNDVISEFAVDEFEDWLYWRDWPLSTPNCSNDNKFSGKNLKIVAMKLEGSEV